MKKTFLLAGAIALFGAASVCAQNSFQHESFVALPVGDASDISSFGLGANTSYLFDVSDRFQIGPTVGFSNFFGKKRTVTIGGVSAEIEIDDIQFLPVAAAAKYNFSDVFFIRADVGYAFGINKGNEGGVYFRPKLGYNLSDSFNVNFGYSRYTNSNDFDEHITALQLGVGFSF